MATKSVTVVIDGKETVSDAADKAEGGLSGFLGRAKGLILGAAALGVGAALGGFFKKAIEEALEGEQSIARLRTAVGHAGESFAEMRPKIDATVGNLMRFTTFTDDELYGALTDMTVATGDAQGSLKNLGLAADIAAQTGKPLEEVSKALAKAMEGNTTAIVKMLPELKGSSDVMSDLHNKFDGAAALIGGTFAGTMTRAKNQFNEFAQSVGDAIIGSDGLTGSGNILIDMLADMQQWVEDNKEEIGKFVDALTTIVTNIGEAVVPIFKYLWFIAKPILLAFTGLITEASFAVRSLTVVWQESVGKILQFVGDLVEKGGTVLKAFGITVVTEAGTSMREFGEKMDKEASQRWDKLGTDFKDFHSRMKSTGDQSVKDVEKQEKDKTTIVRAAHKDQEQSYEDYAKKVKAWWKIVDDAAVSHKEILKTMQPAVQEAMKTGAIEGHQRALDAARETADQLVKNMMRVPITKPAIEAATAGIKDLGDKLEAGARAALDAAQSVGAIGAEAASSLTSVINLSAGIGKLLTGDPLGGATAIVGALANIGSKIFNGDAERKALVKSNTTQLEWLTKEMGNLRLDVTGDQFAGVQSALGSVIGQLRGGRGAQNQIDVLNALSSRGLGFSDLKKVAEQLGIQITSSSGALSVDGLHQLFQAMGMVEVGQFGNDFNSQLDATKSGFDVFDTDAAGQASQLSALFGKFSPALAGVFDAADLGGSKSRLQALFTRLRNGGVGAGELGGLTGTQFLDAITTLLGLVDQIEGDSGGGGGGGSGAGGGLIDTAPVTSSLPGSSLRDVFDSLERQTVKLGDYHRDSLGYLSTIADNTGATAENTRDIVPTLNKVARILSGGRDIGNQVALDQLRAGNASLG